MVRYHAVGARIGIDARNIQRVPNGLGTYARQLVEALATLESPHTFVVVRRPNSGPPVTAHPSFSEVIIDGDPSTPGLGRAFSRLHLDLFHSLQHFLPLGLRVPRTVVTLHDLIWLEHPSLIRSGGFAPLSRTITHCYARVAMRHAVERADRVLAISAYTRARALAYFGLPASRVDVVHLGVAHERFAPGPPSTADDGLYFLCLGNSRPYKNLPTAVHAFAAVAREDRRITLVIAGRGDSTPALTRLAVRLGVADRVIFETRPPHERLRALLQGALALIFPSIVEGFGLPVLEAMASGCPVIISTCPTLTEIAGDAALACDASNPASFADAMRRLRDDSALRAQLRARGMTRAAAFTWGRCAAQTLAVYDDVLAGAPARLARAV